MEDGRYANDGSRSMAPRVSCSWGHGLMGIIDKKLKRRRSILVYRMMDIATGEIKLRAKAEATEGGKGEIETLAL